MHSVHTVCIAHACKTFNYTIRTTEFIFSLHAIHSFGIIARMRKEMNCEMQSNARMRAHGISQFCKVCNSFAQLESIMAKNLNANLNVNTNFASSNELSANIKRITIAIEDTLKRANAVRDAAERNDLDYFQRKELAQELRNIEISVSYVRMATKLLKLDAKHSGS
ncbi:hypothetical protein [Caudoviricetes sp.]|nr:hypothetical protein [Caudoviricetes sp.]UOF82754.1 hypothetical protein [Caudoviricetes sp.]